MDGDAETQLGEFSRRVAQFRCPACAGITMNRQCPRCGQIIPRPPERVSDPPGGAWSVLHFRPVPNTEPKG